MDNISWDAKKWGGRPPPPLVNLLTALTGSGRGGRKVVVGGNDFWDSEKNPTDRIGRGGRKVTV